MKKYFLVMLQPLIWTGCAHKGSEIERRISSQQNDQVQIAVDEAQIKGKLPGIAVLVWEKGQIRYFNSQGKRSLQKTANVTPQDKWHLGSDTKAMTAFLIALAVEKGQLSYQSKLIDIVGRSVPFHPLNSELTLSNLLTHESGLKDVQEVQGGKLWRKLFNSKKALIEQRFEMMRVTLAEAPHADSKNSALPMRGFSYANINYIILGAILEIVNKLDWENLLKQSIFRSLQMHSCGFGVAGSPDETEPSQPWPHIIDDGKLFGVPPKEKLDNPPKLGPAGTVHCNLEDWRKFIAEVTETWNGRSQLLKNKDIGSKYFTNAKDSSYTYGGWVRIEDKYRSVVFSHDGSNSFNKVYLLLVVEKILRLYRFAWAFYIERLSWLTNPMGAILSGSNGPPAAGFWDSR
jgi:D-alanyl-D-alanine carboxypeptidase